MHTIYAFTLRVLILAAVLYIVALQFGKGKTIPIKTAYERQHMAVRHEFGATTGRGHKWWFHVSDGPRAGFQNHYTILCNYSPWTYLCKRAVRTCEAHIQMLMCTTDKWSCNPAHLAPNQQNYKLKHLICICSDDNAQSSTCIHWCTFNNAAAKLI